MESERIIEILETYRPGEGLESDPEVREALQLASADPELARLREKIERFDESIRNQMRRIEAPAGLREAILAAHQGDTTTRTAPQATILSWFHPAAFAAAAAIILLLALSFTFWKRPEPASAAEEFPQMALANSNLMQTAQTLYASLRPKFKSSEGQEILNYLNSQGGAVPVRLPGNIAWDKSFACDVVQLNGTKVSVICFTAPDNSRSMHLFTFERSAFPECQVPKKPQICNEKGKCSAAWQEEEQIHVLFSDKGQENLSAILDI